MQTRDLLVRAGSLITASLAGCIDGEDGPEPTGEPSPSPSTTESPDLDIETGDGPTVVADGEAQAPIVVAADHRDSVDEAVDELNHWIERMAGTTLPVETHDEWDGERPVVAVGHSPLTEELDVDVSDLEEEGAEVLITDDELVLVGRDDPGNDTMTWRGSYYAVRQFLRSIGCFQVWPGELGEVSPDVDTLSPETDNWTWETSWPFARARRVYYYDNLMGGRYTPRWEIAGFDPVSEETVDELMAEEETWLKRNTASNLRPSHRDRVLYGHAFQSFWDEQGEDHPEWFAKPPEDLGQEQPEASAGSKNIKLNPTSEEMYDHVVEQWRDDFEGNPTLHRALNVCPNDAPFFCTREESRELDRGTNSHLSDMDVWEGRNGTDVTNRYVTFYNRFAERVAEVDEDAWVAGYAYQRYTGPPTETEIEHDNIVLGHARGASRHLDDTRAIDHWEGWDEMGLERAFWRPNQQREILFGPFPYTEKWSQTLEKAADFGMIGLDIGGIGYSHWSVNAPLYYILGEKFWNPHATRDEILSGFYEAFGPAADHIRDYFEFWEEQQKAHEMPEEYQELEQMRARPLATPIMYTDERLTEAESILDGARDTLGDGDAIYRDRIEFLQKGLDHTRVTAETLRSLFEWELTGDSSALERARSRADDLQNIREEVAETHHVHVYAITWVEQSTFNIWGVLSRGDDGLNNADWLPESVYRTHLGLEDSDESSDTDFEVIELPQAEATVDGELQEYGDPILTVDEDFSVYRGEPTVEGDIWLAWNDDYLYLATDFNDPDHDQENAGDNLWNGDAIQFAASPGGRGDSVNWDGLNIALTPEGPQVVHRPMPGGSGSLLEDGNVEIIRDKEAERTRYEVAIPWEQLDTHPDEGVVSLSVAIIDYEEGAEAGLLEFAGGIFGDKDNSLFAEAELQDNGDAA